MAAVRRPSARSIPCLSSGRTLTTRVRLANQRVKRQPKRCSSTHPPTHPPCLLPDEPGGGVGWTRDVTARDWRHHLFDVTAEHRPLQVVAGWLAIRDVIAVRSAEENFCSNGARRFHVKFLVKWIMDFVEAEIIVSCTCLNDEGKGLGIRLLD